MDDITRRLKYIVTGVDLLLERAESHNAELTARLAEMEGRLAAFKAALGSLEETFEARVTAFETDVVAEVDRIEDVVERLKHQSVVSESDQRLSALRGVL